MESIDMLQAHDYSNQHIQSLASLDFIGCETLGKPTCSTAIVRGTLHTHRDGEEVQHWNTMVLLQSLASDIHKCY